jgi:hypothetical protein
MPYGHRSNRAKEEISMSADDLLKRLRERPFVPFTVVTTDGTRYEIRHPEMLLPARRYVAIGRPAQIGDEVPDQIVHLSLLHLQRIEFAEPAAGGR